MFQIFDKRTSGKHNQTERRQQYDKAKLSCFVLSNEVHTLDLSLGYGLFVGIMELSYKVPGHCTSLYSIAVRQITINENLWFLIMWFYEFWKPESCPRCPFIGHKIYENSFSFSEYNSWFSSRKA